MTKDFVVAKEFAGGKPEAPKHKNYYQGRVAIFSTWGSDIKDAKGYDTRALAMRDAKKLAASVEVRERA